MTTGLPRSALLATYWRDSNYLAAIPLTTSTILDYFSYSSFFLPSSNNEILRMQSLADPSSSARREAGAIERDLRRFVGTEYVLAHAKPPGLFVVHKRWRSSPTTTQVIEAYYVISGNVYMAPDLYTLLGNRMLSTISHLRTSMALVRAARPPMDRREGARWKIVADPEEEEEEDGEERDGEEQHEAENEAAAVEGGGDGGQDKGGPAPSTTLDIGAGAAPLANGHAPAKRLKRERAADGGRDEAQAQAQAQGVEAISTEGKRLKLGS